jgi:hypothetical protein
MNANKRVHTERIYMLLVMMQSASPSGDTQVVIPKSDASEIRQAKMVCFVVEFGEVIGDSFYDAYRRKDK